MNSPLAIGSCRLRRYCNSRLAALVLCFACLAPLFSEVRAQSVAEMEKEKKAAEQEIKETRAELNANEKKVNSGLSNLRKIESDIKSAQAEIDLIEKNLREINSKISSLETDIAARESELNSLRAEYLSAVKKMRVARKKNSGLSFLFASKSFNEARRRLRYMKQFSEWKERRSDEIKEKMAVLDKQKNELVQARADADVALKRQLAAQEKLDRQRREQQVAVEELRANSDALRSKLAKRQAEARKLSNQISALIAEQQAREAEERRKRQEAERKRKEEEQRLAQEKAAKEKAAKEKSTKEKKTDKKTKESQDNNADYAEARKRKPRTSTTPAEPAASTESGFGGMKGRLPRPVAGNFSIVSPFGVHPISPELPDIMDENLGIDAHVTSGAHATAVYEGEVIKIYDRTNTPGFRNIVVLKHGDYITVYANLETLAVKTGQKVKQGDKLGTVGTDFDDPSYGLLHFELWKNQTHLDPAAWIK